MRNVVVGIALPPRFQHPGGFVAIAGDVVVIFFRNVVSLSLTHAIAQIVSLLRILGRQFGLERVVVYYGKSRIGQRKVWIQLNGAFVKRNSFSLCARGSLLIALRKGLECFQ